MQVVAGEVLCDIFGKQIGSNYESGLLDAASSESFWKSLHRVKECWNNLERSCDPSKDPVFHNWFCKHKANEIVSCAILAVRKRARITRQYTTNNSESINHVLKQEVEWKENKLPTLIQCIKNIVDRHVGEIEKAVIGRGQWKFCQDYSNLIVVESTWFFGMSKELKEKCMKKVFTRQLVSCQIDRSSHQHNPLPCLDVSSDECGITTIQSTTLRSIWNKAADLLMGKNIIPVPWMTDTRACLVKSSSSEQPSSHYKCDDKCPMFKGYKLCSHVVVVSQENGDLVAFLKYYNSRDIGPNLSSIALRGMPAGAGKKGGTPNHKRKQSIPIETRSVRPFMDHSDTSSLPLSLPSTSGAASNSVPPISSVSPHPTSDDTLSASSHLHTSDAIPSVPLVAVTMPSSLPINITTPNSGASSSIINITSPTVSPTELLPIYSSCSHLLQPSQSFSLGSTNSNPFILKFKTPQIRVCQACRKDYQNDNDTMGLVVSRAERQLVSNLSTGSQFLGRESNSHYHLHMKCLSTVCPAFNGRMLEIPHNVKANLSLMQKMYLNCCFGIQL